MKHQSKVAFFAIGFCLSFFTTLAQSDTVVVDSHKQVIDLGHQVEYFIDKTGKLGIDEVSAPSMAKNFHQEKAEVPNFNGEQNRVWFRFVLSNKLNEPVYLQLDNPAIPHFDLYEPRVGNWHHTEIGSFNTRLVRSSIFFIKIESSNKPITIYGSLFAESAAPYWVPLKIGGLPALSAPSRNYEFVMMLFLGGILVMILYNIVLFFMTADRLYGYYVLYLFAAALFFIYLNGYLYEWFLPNQITSTNLFWIIGLLFFCSTLFCNKLLEPKKHLPKIYLISYALYALSILISVIGFLPVSAVGKLTVKLMDFANVAVPVYCLIVSVWLAKKRLIMAYFFLSGWIPLIVGSILFGLNMEGVFYSHFVSHYAIGLGMVWEAAVFSLALGYRFNLIRKERMEVQAENLRLVSEQNQLLEQKVRERTRTIDEQNQELQTQNEEMQALNEEMQAQVEQLSLQHEQIEVQQEELQHRNEELTAQQERLAEQNATIEDQNQRLLGHSARLEATVEARTRELALANAELAYRFDQLSEFAFMIAHNLRGPISRLLGLDYLLRQVKEPPTQQSLDMIGTAAAELDQVAKDITFVLELGDSQEVELGQVPLAELVEEVLSEAGVPLQGCGGRATVSLSVASAYASRPRLLEVLGQLVGNSIKFRKPEVPLVIAISSEEKGGEVVLRISDNGLGLDMELFRGKAFKLYQRYHTHREGRGFGLYLVRVMVESFGGTISVEGRLGEGTTFTIVMKAAGQGH
jgi:signal transduction histidine kinase